MEHCSNLACGSPDVVVRAFNPEFGRDEWYCQSCWESQISFKRLSLTDAREVIAPQVRRLIASECDIADELAIIEDGQV